MQNRIVEVNLTDGKSITLDTMKITWIVRDDRSKTTTILLGDGGRIEIKGDQYDRAYVDAQDWIKRRVEVTPPDYHENKNFHDRWGYSHTQSIKPFDPRMFDDDFPPALSLSPEVPMMNAPSLEFIDMEIHKLNRAIDDLLEKRIQLVEDGRDDD